MADQEGDGLREERRQAVKAGFMASVGFIGLLGGRFQQLKENCNRQPDRDEAEEQGERQKRPKTLEYFEVVTRMDAQEFRSHFRVSRRESAYTC